LKSRTTPILWAFAQRAPSFALTQPPPRYSEASLVKRMEELGIGRPSTYASILKVLQDRGYVLLDKRRFTPDAKGRLVTAFLENFFSRYVQYDYTADLEERLDKVSAGDLNWKVLLRDFWTQFAASVLRPLVFPDKEDGSDPRKCTSCDDGELSLKLGKFGAFVGCSNYPECKFTRPFGDGNNPDAENEDTMLGEHPDGGEAEQENHRRDWPLWPLYPLRRDLCEPEDGRRNV